MHYPFVRLVVPCFIVTVIIAGFYIGRYVSPMYIPMVGIVYFILMSVFVVFLNGSRCIRNQKGLLYVLLGILVVHAIYFILLYVYSKPYRDRLEKDLNYLYAFGSSWLICSVWAWFCLPKIYLESCESPSLLELFMTNFLVFIVVMFTAPNYADYTDRTYISEGLAISAGTKAASVEFYEKEKRFPKDNKEAGLVEPNQITGQSVKAIEILPQGKIKITYNNKLADDAFIVLEAILDDKDKITWQCRESDLLEMKMIPANCRGQIDDFNSQNNSDHP